MTGALDHARLNASHSPVLQGRSELTLPSVVPNSVLAVHTERSTATEAIRAAGAKTLRRSTCQGSLQAMDLACRRIVLDYAVYLPVSIHVFSVVCGQAGRRSQLGEQARHKCASPATAMHNSTAEAEML